MKDHSVSKCERGHPVVRFLQNNVMKFVSIFCDVAASVLWILIYRSLWIFVRFVCVCIVRNTLREGHGLRQHDYVGQYLRIIEARLLLAKIATVHSPVGTHFSHNE